MIVETAGTETIQVVSKHPWCRKVQEARQIRAINSKQSLTRTVTYVLAQHAMYKITSDHPRSRQGRNGIAHVLVSRSSRNNFT